MTQDSPTRLLEASGLGQRVQTPEGPLTLLADITLSLNQGEALAILGASGSGKSTLLGLLAGLDLPSDGHCALFGHNLNTLDEEARAALRAGRVGFVFQSFQLLPGLSALENVALPLELRGDTDALKKAQAALEDVGLGARLQHDPARLSGGEQQRVAVARAFAPEPEILFADEPTANLDVQTGALLADQLFALRQRHNTALVLVTHDPALAARCDRQLHLHQGRIVDKRV
ncbi:MAG: ABC transporter ATP-binding protein [Gammaproteobacteria bacterium]